MNDPASERLGRSLLRLAGAASFAAVHQEPALGLSLEVDGVGRCDFPLSSETIRALVDRAVPSPFGYRERTVRDPSVRDSWEIPGAHVHLDERLWSTRFERGLGKIVEALGLPLQAEVTPTLQKLLVYEEGQFFARHRDSEKSPSMVGTLVVVLPSTYRGGDVVVSHAGKTVTLSTAKAGRTNSMSFLGFYADCVHETRPVEAGYRVALSYSLDVGAGTSPGGPREGLADLKQSLEAFFHERDDDDEVVHPWLVYFFDHQYSEQSIGWSRLKNADKMRAEALSQVAGELDCDCFLALADVHESYAFDEDDEDEDEDEVVVGPDDEDPDAAPFVSNPEADDPLEELTFQGGPEAPSGAEISASGSLLARDVTLERWVTARGEPCTGTDEPVDDTCVVTTVESHGRIAYETQSEPWTGNEGGTADKWYHQAALVVIPRSSPLHEEVAQPLPAPAATPLRVRKRRRP
jgi:hypothetical protein